MDQTAVRVGLKCATMQHGAQCVMTTGTMLMLRWSADSLDSPQQVQIQLAVQVIKPLLNNILCVPPGATAILDAFFGQGNGSIWLDDVECAGNETRLIACPRSPIGIHNCGHHEDASVRCQGK